MENTNNNTATFAVGQVVKVKNRNYTIAQIIPSKPNLAAHQIAKGWEPFNYVLTRTPDLVELKRLAQYSLVSKSFR